MRSGQAGLTTPQVKSGNDDGLPTIAALYVETNGAYFGLEGVDPWDEARDARLYDGPWPVVAHPPCNKWSPLVYINQQRLPGYKVGDDGGCFAAALEAVRRFGGVLEHPATSLAWRRFELPTPSRGVWTRHLADEAWVTEVSQSAYGHRARKRTWLYFVGLEPPAMRWDDPPVTAIVSGFLHHGAGAYVADEARRVRPREASATPHDFRDALVTMARSTRPPFTLCPDGRPVDGRARARGHPHAAAGPIPPKRALISTAL